MKKLGVTFLLAFPAAGLVAGLFALVFGFFCVRLTRIYFAMLTLAFAQIVWAICFKWNEVTGGEQGMPEIPYPSFDWVESLAAVLPFLGGYRTSEYFYFLTLVLVGVCFWVLRRIVGSPFGRMLTTIRENPERAEFIGVNVRRYELAAFVLAGAFAGLAGGLFGIFNRGVFPDFAYWTKSSEVLIMTLLGGMGTFYGPALGALVLLWLNQQIVVVHRVLAARSSAASWSSCSSSSRAASRARVELLWSRVGPEAAAVLEVRDVRQELRRLPGGGRREPSRCRRARSAPSSARTARARPRCST